MQADAPVLTSEDGSTIPGFLVPARDVGLILVHEVLGLNEQMRGVARRYAAEGFTVFAIDLLGGRTAPDMSLGFRNAQLVNWKTAVEQIRRAVHALAARAEGGEGMKVGILGFGFGGGMAIAAAAAVPEIAACVTFYGIPTAEKANLVQIRCKVQGHFARYDRHVSNDRVDAFEARLQEAGVEVDVHRYHAEHAFFNEKLRDSYSASNTELTFRRSAAFLKKELTGSY